MRGVNCKFCECMADLKECHGIAQSRETDEDLREYGEWMQELTVAIVERNWYRKKSRKSAGRTVHYRNQGLGFELRFCPECGKRLR